ncbi:hypothetical protein [Sphingopyxis sp. QXT-31]|nr:hypothetical protein [Sphingopyxis sp. QXT-31]
MSGIATASISSALNVRIGTGALIACAFAAVVAMQNEAATMATDR